MAKADPGTSYSPKSIIQTLEGFKHLKLNHSSREQLRLAWPRGQHHSKPIEKPEGGFPHAAMGSCDNSHASRAQRSVSLVVKMLMRKSDEV